MRVRAQYEGVTFVVVKDNAGLNIIPADGAGFDDLSTSPNWAGILLDELEDYGLEGGLRNALVGVGAVLV
jgi:hypothetical protein